ncbi:MULTISPECIES: TetR/AcrR family transcriptional regulator [Kitasatospora]|uniref:TetR/AcrR family transcriptional regulator n=1 Tax=Kitasatospora TaxID=2063 RepID=UPI000C706C8B|nr:TetR/AcrR family transcriptional regulator C-terminal domain-containing protein [Kitasatospora sp. GP30]MDH6145551.1 AcrR family transcriptional regulator [Kitasatospora sp. GP30]
MGEERTAPEVVWTRARRAPRRQPMTLERIVDAAIGIADTEGLEALSMRRVAAQLDSGTTSLYRNVTSRDELLDLMIDAVQGEEMPLPFGDWRACLRTVARHQRTILLRHPWLGGVMSTRPAFGPNTLRRTDIALGAAGILTPDITLASDIVVVLTQHVFGAVSRELADREAQRRTGLTETQWRASIGPYIREVVASGEYPHFARRVIEATDHTFDELFEFGLDCLLDGIAGKVGERS